ncbi:serine carboxypeptidase S28-domain-containing protein [Hypoxylon crocopeplum]|nr:serine carboxypeptidase S28-domain-containing protein [Hypoxylon crocopeplum]
MLFCTTVLAIWAARLSCVNAQALPPSSYVPKAQNFTQKLNHDKPNDKTTFQQLYQMDATHFKPGGPILFHQSEESTMVPIASNAFFDYAPEVGGILAGLEHRFFGSSFPARSTYDNITTEDYKPLTLDNVLRDGVEFVNWIRRTVPGAENSPVIYTGGSYGGFLAVMARVRHPETFHGSLSIAPLLTSFGHSSTLADNPFKFAATDWVAQVYYDASVEAAIKIRDALSTLNACVSASNCTAALPDFNLCTQPTNKAEWSSLLWDLIAPQYALVPQFDLGTLGQVLRAPIALATGAMNLTSIESASCADWANYSTSASVGLGAAWDYISCTYYIVTETDVSPTNPLYPTHDEHGPYTGCDTAGHPDWVGPSFNWRNQQWLEHYRITDAELDKVERLLIVQGSHDRTAAVGMPKLTPSPDRNHARVILGEGLAHGETIASELVEPKGVKTQLDDIRGIQLEYIKAWTGSYGGASNAATGAKVKRVGPVGRSWHA